MVPPLVSSALEEVGNTSGVLANANFPRRQLLNFFASLVVSDDAAGEKNSLVMVPTFEQDHIIHVDL